MTTLLSVVETASRLRTSPAQVRFLIKTDKDFPCYAYGSKSHRIIAEKLDNWILIQTQRPVLLMAEQNKKTTTKRKTATKETANA